MGFDDGVWPVCMDSSSGVRRRCRLWDLCARRNGPVGPKRRRNGPSTARQDLDPSGCGRDGLPAGAGRRSRADSGLCDAGQANGFSPCSRRARTGPGLQYGYRAGARRRPDREDRLQGRPNGQSRRSAGRHRSAAVSGRARPGDREEGAGRSQPRQRQTRSDALRHPGEAEFRHPTAARYPELAGQSAHRVHSGGRRGGRGRQGSVELHDHSRPDFRPGGVPAHRRRQSRQRRAADRHRHDRPAAADRRRLHRAAGAGRRNQSGAHGR